MTTPNRHFRGAHISNRKMGSLVIYRTERNTGKVDVETGDVDVDINDPLDSLLGYVLSFVPIDESITDKGELETYLENPLEPIEEMYDDDFIRHHKTRYEALKKATAANSKGWYVYYSGDDQCYDTTNTKELLILLCTILKRKYPKYEFAIFYDQFTGDGCYDMKEIYFIIRHEGKINYKTLKAKLPLYYSDTVLTWYIKQLSELGLVNVELSKAEPHKIISVKA